MCAASRKKGQTARMARSSRILLVVQDDDERNLLALLLRGRGYIVDAESHITDSAHYADDAPDLVIWDSDSPEGDVRPLLRRLPLPRERLLLLTARDPESSRAALGVDCLQKPLNVAAFLDRVERSAGRPRLAEGGGRVELELYVHVGTATARAAISRLAAALKHCPAESVSVTTIDVSSSTTDGHAFLLTPVLVRNLPLPRARLLGDLSDRETLHEWLRSSGLVLSKDDVGLDHREDEN